MNPRVGRLARRGDLNRGPVLEFLAFVLDGELYAVQLTKIREILSPPPITEVPRSAPEILGVCSVRGLLVTVIDLRRRLGVTAATVSRRSRILLAESDQGEVIGLLVDEVRQVIRLSESDVELASAVLGGDVAEHFIGIGRAPGAEFILLDLASVVPA
ncbi:MAG: chemotaxis protein CheW [Polyangiaceae bacterium]|nr:chemotaxis protein CheW [Polyangiaceae bacterium]